MQHSRLQRVWDEQLEFQSHAADRERPSGHQAAKRGLQQQGLYPPLRDARARSQSSPCRRGFQSSHRCRGLREEEKSSRLGFWETYPGAVRPRPHAPRPGSSDSITAAAESGSMAAGSGACHRAMAGRRPPHMAGVERGHGV